MTATSSPTDRYVAATLRSLPGRQRQDIEAELRALIADAIDDRREAGVDADSAERQVLTELGAPARLAASYSERSLHLIGPEFYLDYVRVLMLLLSTLVPLWFVIFGLVTFADGSTAGVAFGGALYSALETAMSIAFFTTLVFAVIERVSAVRTKRTATWDPSSLPEVRDKRDRFSVLIGGVIFLAVIVISLVLIQTVGAVEGPGGARVGPVDSGLWESGVFYIALLIAIASIPFHLLAYYTGWSTANAIANTVFVALFAVPAVWLAASGRLLSDDYFRAVGWPEGADVIAVVVIVFVLLITASDAVGGWVRASKKRRTR
ncbi:permease prefix domain 1-containing protein [Arthrobacter sp. H20]|uniref:permease prefix domain 1-containing protein n=1 Tax=Arthrobacter sp. H20 TaxID=1267981 RepID=UPI0004B82D15|nr:permease prefix domain 1-containing protein [Arthrobacter sp. H20]